MAIAVVAVVAAAVAAAMAIAILGQHLGKFKVLLVFGQL